MEGFRETLDHCELFDLGLSGLPWTYDNRKKGDCNVKVRLDKVLASACSGWISGLTLLCGTCFITLRPLSGPSDLGKGKYSKVWEEMQQV
jgi:hypothetical protein